MSVQLELFERTKEEKMEEEIAVTKVSVDNLRKGIFKRHTDISKTVTSLQGKIEELEMQIMVLEGYLKKKE